MGNGGKGMSTLVLSVSCVIRGGVHLCLASSSRCQAMGEVHCKQEIIQFSGQPDKNGCLWHLLEIRLLKLREGYKVFSVTQLINDKALGFAPRFFWLQR